MISNLSISNYALIRQLQLTPDKGLNIVTGETGAGKSIMLGAVGLLLGNRADVKALLDTEKKCVVEGEFNLTGLDLESYFQSEDLDYDAHTIIRREVNPNGKSRAFINDQPVTLDILKTLGIQLLDIHSQNESIQLGDKSIKMKVIDGFAQTLPLLKKYQIDYKVHQELNVQLETAMANEKKFKKDSEYNGFLLDELVKADLKIEEQARLEDEQNLLENAEEIKLKLSEIINEFDVTDLSLNDKLRQATNTLKNLVSFSKDLQVLSERFESATTEIIDVVQDIYGINESVEHDPERMEIVSQRLDLINRLQQKHQVLNVEGLLAIQHKLEEEALNTLNLTSEIAQLTKKVDVAKKSLIQSAEALSEKRRKCIDQFSNQLNQLLKEVGMPDGRVETVYKRVEPWKLGIDEVEFLFSANKGIKPEPVGNVASGGEYSRLMFCIKYLLADKTAMPTVIFDEIDTGVSGEIAIKLAAMMKKMAGNHQIIAISHLPQIAAKGDAHFFVYKDNQSKTTESLIRKLEETDRLKEIAKMIGGDGYTDTALNSAKELIGKI